MQDPPRAFPAPSRVRTSLLACPLSTACQGSTAARTAGLLWAGHVDSTARTAEKLARVSSEDNHR